MAINPIVAAQVTNARNGPHDLVSMLLVEVTTVIKLGAPAGALRIALLMVEFQSSRALAAFVCGPQADRSNQRTCYPKVLRDLVIRFYLA
jgi:hypothetical protein